MNDFATIDTPSTVIDTDPTPSAAGGGQVPIADPEAKTPSVRDDIEHAFKLDDRRKADAEAKAKEPPAKVEDKAKDAEKPAPEAKEGASEPAKAPEAEKPAAKPEDAAEAKEQSEQEKADQREGKRNIEPPAKMLPRAKELWRNTPREVQTEIERITREHEEFASQARASTERYDQIRQFDELAKSNGRDLRESLSKINHIENMMARNPIAGLAAILSEIGPRKADGQAVSLFEVAQHIVSQGPQGYQQMVAQAQPQQQEDPRVVQLQQQLAEREEQMIVATIIDPFKAEHPRYDELEGHIASFLNSDMIPRSLSAADRLAAAYDMAVRINPSAQVDPTAQDRSPAPQADRRADEDFSGSRSIKSAPGGVTEDFEDEAKSGESIRDSLRSVMRRQRA